MNSKKISEIPRGPETLASLADNQSLDKLLDITGMLEPKINQLAAFEVDLKQQIESKDEKLSEVLDEILKLEKLIEISTLQKPTSNSALAVLKSDLEHQQRLLKFLQPAIEQVLTVNFTDIINFVLEDLTDQQLEKFGTDRKIIIDSLYRNLAFYLDKFRISRKVIKEVEHKIRICLAHTQNELEELIKPSQELIADVQVDSSPSSNGGGKRKPMETLLGVGENEIGDDILDQEEEKSPETVRGLGQSRAHFPTLGYEEMQEKHTTKPSEEDRQKLRRTLRPGSEMFRSPDVEEKHKDTFEELLAASKRGIATVGSLRELAEQMDASAAPQSADQEEKTDWPIPSSRQKKESTLPPLPERFRKPTTLAPETPRSIAPIIDSAAQNNDKDEEKGDLITAKSARESMSSGKNSGTYIARIALKKMSSSQLPLQINPDPEPEDNEEMAPQTLKGEELVSLTPLKEEAARQSGLLTKMRNWFGKHKKGLLVALAVGMGGGTGLYLYENSQSKLKQVDIVSQNSKSSKTFEKKTPVDLKTNRQAPKTMPAPKQVQKTPEKITISEKKVNPKYLSFIKDSKSRPLQQMLHDGEYTLGSLSILDSMIAPFKGLANDRQKAEIADFEQEIREGLVIYFYEKFGTEEARAQSLKNPKLRNLYRTARHVKLSDLRKHLSPQRYAQARNLGIQILEKDGEAFGYNVSSNPALKAWTQGNMFQAHSPNSKIRIQKTDGSLNVILQKMDQIFDGAFSANLAKKVPVQSVQNISGGTNIQLQSPAMIPGGGQILPNIAPLQNFSLDPAQGFELPTAPALPQTKIKNPASKQPDTNATDQAWDEISSMHETDFGWDVLLDRSNQKIEFEKSGEIRLSLDKTLTRAQEKKIVLDKTVEALTQLFGESNHRLIEKFIKQFGFVAFKEMDFDDKGNVKAVMAPRVKAILLQTLKISKS